MFPFISQLQQFEGSDSNPGTSVDEAFGSTHAALDALSPGDTLLIVGELSNPSYDHDYQFTGDVSDSHLWHNENTLYIDNVHGAAEAWITISSYDDSTIIKDDGGNIVRMKH